MRPTWARKLSPHILVLAALLLQSQPGTDTTPSNPSWGLNYGPPTASGAAQELEREAGAAHLSPAQTGRALRNRLARLFQEGRLAAGQPLDGQLQADLFNCVEPSRQLYERFVKQFNRSQSNNENAAEQRERLGLFALTLKRAILFNRIVQDTVSNRTNYRTKPEIRNYHFIEPTGPIQQQNEPQPAGQAAAGGLLPLFADQSQGATLSLWFADLTDCELGLIKKIIFDIFYLIDRNQFEIAYQLASENSLDLPLLNEDGFEQLANVLLVRLNDRFQDNEKMNQLFQWPVYLKKLAAYAYSRRQLAQPDSRAKLVLISFAYPAYFKDLKYNWPAINRTGDNLRANSEHVLFNGAFRRKFSNIDQRNKRLAIFRQRWSLISRLNQKEPSGEQQVASMGVLNILPDWLRVSQAAAPSWPQSGENLPTNQFNGQPTELDNNFGAEQRDLGQARSEKLTDLPDSAYFEYQQLLNQHQRRQKLFNWTQFSDLTDAEFVAYLNNDYAILDQNPDSIQYLRQNFPIVALDAGLKEDLALELELRRALLANLTLLATIHHHHNQPPMSSSADQPQIARPSLQLARQVIEELISDVGLPIGPVDLDRIEEAEYFEVFNKICDLFRKPYAADQAAAPLPVSPSARLLSLDAQPFAVSSADLADERQRRFQQFKTNYGRFKAWFIKEGWMRPSQPADGSILNERQLLAMLRLADMSWAELKLSLFKICCLDEENLASLANSNATLQYLASNYQLLCQVGPLAPTNRGEPDLAINASAPVASRADLVGLELFYYYSVHFNKHHSLNPVAFEQRFAIFRRNLDSIRRHSCKRSLALFDSLKLRQFDTLNTIDTLDPRRSFFDDLNLDRFEFFRLEPMEGRLGGSSAETNRNRQQEQQALFQRFRDGSDLIALNSAASQPLTSRAGVTYRREPPFSSLWRPSAGAGGPKAERLQRDDLDQWGADQSGLKYAQNNAARVYELVMQRYKICMRTAENVGSDISGGADSPANLRCHTNGKLADRTLLGGATSLLAPELELGAAGQAWDRLKGQESGPCEYYWQGLEPWNEGLIRQHSLSPQLIQGARCVS